MFWFNFSSFQGPQNWYLIIFSSFLVRGEVLWGRMSSIEADMAWNMGIPCKTFKSLIKLYFSCLVYFCFPILSKNISKERFLFMLVIRYAGHWGSYILKQGNPLKFYFFVVLTCKIQNYCIRINITTWLALSTTTIVSTTKSVTSK